MAKVFTKTCVALCNKCTPWGLSLLRVVLGAILLNHGWIKLFGDNAGLLAFFESTVLPAPGAMLMLAGIIELVGGIALILGVYTRVVAFIVALEFVVIVFIIKLSQGFTALEFELLLLASLIAITCIGGGAATLPHLFGKGGKHGGHGAEAMGGRE